MVSTAAHRIGIFGGTFDPVHFGHLRPALELAESLSLDSVSLLPCHLPAHRDAPGASTVQRIDMLRLAIKGTDRLVVDSREAERDTPSYSVDTLKLFREDHPDAKLLFFMGMDAFTRFTHWYQWEEILTLAHLVVVPRPNAQLSGPEERLLMSRQVATLEDLTTPAGRIIVQSVSQSDISATRIRALVKAGRDIRYLVPDTVHRYIIQNRLYC